MKPTAQDIRWFLIPFGLSFITLFTHNHLDIFLVNEVVGLTKAVLQGQVSLPWIQVSFYAAMLLVGFKLSFGDLARSVGGSGKNEVPARVAFFANAFVSALSIVAGFMLADAITLLLSGDRLGYYLTFWAFYIVLSIFGFLLILETAISTYYLAIESWFRDLRPITRGIGYILLVITTGGIVWEALMWFGRRGA